MDNDRDKIPELSRRKFLKEIIAGSIAAIAASVASSQLASTQKIEK